MAVHSIEITTENLLGIIAQMPESEFNRFVEKAKKIRQKNTPPRWTNSELELIKTLNEFVLSPQKQTRFNKLVKKRRNEEISEDELAELIELNEESETLNVERIKILAKLATSKNKTLDEIMDELKIRSPKVI